MPAHHHPLLGPQHDVTVVDAIRREERDRPPVRAFLVRTLRVALDDLGLRQRTCDRQRRLLEQAPHRHAQRDFARRKVTRGLLRPIGPREIGIARCLCVIGLVQAKERPCRPGTRRQGDDLGLDHRARDLVLAPLARQVEPGIDLALVPIVRSQQLHRVRGEPGGPLEAAVRDPGVPAALRQILAAHHHRTAARMAGDVVVDVLRCVGLVVHEEATVAEAHVLHEDRIARHGLRAGVRHLHPPQPEPVLRVQPERDLVAHAAGRTLPDEAIGGGAETDLRAGADRLRDHRLRRADAQVQAGDPAVERGALHLVDQRSTALVLVRDGEDATVGEHAERQAGWVRDAAQAEIAFAGRDEGAGGERRHR